jgi:hypothetical protein
MRFELMTSSLPRRRSTPELRGRESIAQKLTGAGDEIRTRDPQLGRLMLYQLSYTRSTASMKHEVGSMKTAHRVAYFILHPSYFILAPGAGGRIRTCVGREPAGFTARCH